MGEIKILAAVQKIQTDLAKIQKEQIIDFFSTTKGTKSLIEEAQQKTDLWLRRAS